MSNCPIMLKIIFKKFFFSLSVLLRAVSLDIHSFLYKVIYFQFSPNGAFLYNYISACEYRFYTTFGQRVPMLGRVAQATFSQPQTWIPILAGLQINAGIKNFITQAQQFNTFPQFAFGYHICCNLKKNVYLIKSKGQIISNEIFLGFNFSKLQR